MNIIRTNQPSRFSFVDEGEALRRLNIDRDTLLLLVQEKRLRAYPGVGKGNFYKLQDLDGIYKELYAGTGAGGEAVAEGGSGEDISLPGGRKVFDPAYKVQVRLQADLKWYDLEEEDLRTWVRELHADGYVRQRANISRVIAKLERLVALMDQAAAGWKVLEAPEAVSEPQAKSSRKSSKTGTNVHQAAEPGSGE
jgi:hypothetical protein